jgi:hypothetical protein
VSIVELSLCPGPSIRFILAPGVAQLLSMHPETVVVVVDVVVVVIVVFVEVVDVMLVLVDEFVVVVVSVVVDT